VSASAALAGPKTIIVEHGFAFAFSASLLCAEKTNDLGAEKERCESVMHRKSKGFFVEIDIICRLLSMP
jgi:hypothetical protein